MLNDQNIITLAKPFKPEEHGTLQSNPYIRKSAIRARLSQVDVLWSLGAPEYVATEGDVVIYRGSLTVGGVTRWGVGAGIIQRLDANKQPVEGFALAKNIAKAHKTAVTDILARAATEFGIGNYLRDKAWGNMNFNDWIAKVNGDKPSAGQPPQPTANAWADAGSVQHLLNRCAQGLGLTWADVSRLIDIKELEDYLAWNKYAGVGAAADAIKTALDKELAALPPSSPKKEAAAVP